jgi:hypothetical protein
MTFRLFDWEPLTPSVRPIFITERSHYDAVCFLVATNDPHQPIIGGICIFLARLICNWSSREGEREDAINIQRFFPTKLNNPRNNSLSQQRKVLGFAA